MNAIARTTLSNGVRVVAQRIPGLHTVAVGLWIDLGSRDETPELGGVTHFIEHMLFKGTQRRDLFALARDFNILGGNFNAFTSPEQLCLYATVVSEDLEIALTTLAEMLLESIFPEKEIENERGVILEEISESEDQPDEVVEERFYQTLWPGHPLGRPIIGLRDTVNEMDRPKMIDYWRSRFSPARLVVSLAGAVDRRRVIPIVRRLFENLSVAGSENLVRNPPAAVRAATGEHRDLEQIHFCFGVDGPPRCTEDRYNLVVFNTLYGSGMGSRLSNEIRERRGLAYSIWSGLHLFRDVGCFTVRGSTSSTNLPAVVQLSVEEFKRLADEGPTESEVNTARDQCIRSYLLAQESPNSRMSVLGENEIYGMETPSIPDTIQRLRAVNAKSIQEVIQRHIQGKPLTATLVGPLNGHLRLFESLRF